MLNIMEMLRSSVPNVSCATMLTAESWLTEVRPYPPTLYTRFPNVNKCELPLATFRRLNANYQFPAPLPPKANAPVPPHIRNAHGDYDGFDMYGNPVQAVIPTTNNGQHNCLINRQFILILPHVGIQTTRTNEVDEDLTDEELILTPAVVYGFSLSDKVWCTSVTMFLYMAR